MSTLVEYIWIGKCNELRCKTRVLGDVESLSDIPKWNYDGSSTGQASGCDSEVILHPVCLFNDPFRGEDHKMVMCATHRPDGTPLSNNHRVWAKSVFDQGLEHLPWYGMEQEYFLIDSDTNKPLGFPANGHPNPQGQYYCSVGTNNAFGREIADDHLSKCVEAGIKISGINAEVAPGQWEFQIGPCVGLEEGDHLWMARYILNRVAEEHNVIVDYEPKPMKGDWNGSGCHTNYSTLFMREGDGNRKGLAYIDDAIEKLSEKHSEHMEVYGTGNELRMTGDHETSRYDQFSSGRANRGASVRIGNETVNDEKGYFEDRRPSSNCDPYLVTGKIFETTVLN